MVRTTAPAPIVPRPVSDTTHRIIVKLESLNAGLDDIEIGLRPDRRLHGHSIKFAVGLGAGTSHRRTFRTVEKAELDASLIGNPSHEAVQRIDLADEMTLAQAADRRIAGHLADRRKAMRHEGRSCTQAAPQRRPLRMPAWPPPTTMTS